MTTLTQLADRAQAAEFSAWHTMTIRADSYGSRGGHRDRNVAVNIRKEALRLALKQADASL